MTVLFAVMSNFHLNKENERKLWKGIMVLEFLTLQFRKCIRMQEAEK